VKSFLCGLGVLALPAAMFAGQVVFGDGADTVTTTGNSISIGTNTGCSTTCTINGNGNVSGFLLHWVFTTPVQVPATGTIPNFTLSGATGTFSVNDFPSPGGGDTVSGSITLTNAVLSGPGNSTMDLTGTLTASSLTTGGADTAVFLTLLSGLGITTPIPPSKTVAVDFNITNCTNGSQTSCLTSSVVTSVQVAGTTGTLNSITVSSSAVPEPSTLILMFAGLAGLIMKGRVFRRA